jgi:hypothetical protein
MADAQSTLRKRWRDAFENTTEYRRAKLQADAAAELRRRQVDNSYDSAATPQQRLAAFYQKAKLNDPHYQGASAAEANLAALDGQFGEDFNDFVQYERDYVNDMNLKGGVGTGHFNLDRQLENAKPWVKFTGNMGMSKVEQTRNGELMAASHGNSITNEQKIAAARYRNDQLIPKDVLDQYNTEQRKEMLDFDKAQRAEAFKEKAEQDRAIGMRASTLNKMTNMGMQGADAAMGALSKIPGFGGFGPSGSTPDAIFSSEHYIGRKQPGVNTLPPALPPINRPLKPSTSQRG